jgi:HK97 family phage major capsid protein
MSIEDKKRRIAQIDSQLAAMKRSIDDEGREATESELKQAKRLLDEVDRLELQVSQPKNPELDLAMRPQPENVQNRIDRGGNMEHAKSKWRGPGESKDYRSLYGAKEEYVWKDKEINYWQALFSGRAHPELIKRSMMEGIGSEGGFLVPTEYEKQIHDVALENEIVMPRANVIPMTTNQKEVPAFEIGSHASHLFGGFSASYVAEKGTISEASPRVRRMEFNLCKLTALVEMSGELVEDADEESITSLCGKGLAWYRDYYFLRGTGAAEPQGVLNANCLIAVTKPTGQASSTIIYQNLADMLSRLHPACFNNSVWLAHPTTIPQLLQLSVPVGTGGAHYPVLQESNGGFKLLTRPCLFTEKLPALGTQGDILLADFSQFAIGLKKGMRIDHSIHVYFTTDRLLTRLIERHDAMALWDEALTLKDGSTTVSPFIVIEDR